MWCKWSEFDHRTDCFRKPMYMPPLPFWYGVKVKLISLGRVFKRGYRGRKDR